MTFATYKNLFIFIIFNIKFSNTKDADTRMLLASIPFFGYYYIDDREKLPFTFGISLGLSSVSYSYKNYHRSFSPLNVLFGEKREVITRDSKWADYHTKYGLARVQFCTTKITRPRWPFSVTLKDGFFVEEGYLPRFLDGYPIGLKSKFSMISHLEDLHDLEDII